MVKFDRVLSYGRACNNYWNCSFLELVENISYVKNHIDPIQFDMILKRIEFVKNQLCELQPMQHNYMKLKVNDRTNF